MLGRKIRTVLGGCIIEGNLKIRDKGVSKLLGGSLNKDQPAMGRC